MKKTYRIKKEGDGYSVYKKGEKEPLYENKTKDVAKYLQAHLEMIEEAKRKEKTK